MIRVRRSADRGHTQLSWLDSYHTFSFDHYYDQRFMNFGPLRVINEDYIEPGQGFGTHGHRDMEIITYVLAGALEHKDSLGNGSVIRPGEIQRMSAGSGILHSEFNHSRTDKVHLLQIWIVPEVRNMEPSYDQRPFKLVPGQWQLVASKSPDPDAVCIQQETDLYVATVDKGAVLSRSLQRPLAWLQVARGSISLGSEMLLAGDGVAIEQAESLELEGRDRAEILLFEMERR